MKGQPPEALRKSLAEARSYRDFLRIYFEATELPYAEIARRAGFSSRSYPRDLTEGRRRLTARALPTLVRGLRLGPRMSEFFQLLYFQEYPEEYSASTGALLQKPLPDIRQHLDTRVEQARKRAGSARTVRKQLAGSRVLAMGVRPGEAIVRHLFEVLASLGNPERGATLEELRRMSGLDRATLAPILEICVAEGLVRLDHEGARTSRYYPASGHLDLTGMPKHELIRKVFLHSWERARTAAERLYDSDQALFHVSAISVKHAELPRLKAELRALLLRYADAIVEETPDPDTVVYVVGSLFEARRAN